MKHLTAQQIFNKVSVHLMKQYSKSIQKSDFSAMEYCVYKTSDGAMCAAGCLIADIEIKETDNKIRFDNIWHIYPKVQEKIAAEHISLILVLQVIHDMSTMKNWYRDLRHQANLNKFDTKELEEAARRYERI